jgi:membrane-bound ClpP family serine protease
MCHLILALPFVALPMLWLLPLSVGIPLYGVVLVLAIAVYVMTFKTMRLPVTTGTEAMMNAIGTVRSVDRSSVFVWVASERWSATCADGVLAVGDTVEVIGHEGLTLQVRRVPRPATKLSLT